MIYAVHPRMLAVRKKYLDDVHSRGLGLIPCREVIFSCADDAPLLFGGYQGSRARTPRILLAHRHRLYLDEGDELPTLGNYIYFVTLGNVVFNDPAEALFLKKSCRRPLAYIADESSPSLDRKYFHLSWSLFRNLRKLLLWMGEGPCSLTASI